MAKDLRDLEGGFFIGAQTAGASVTKKVQLAGILITTVIKDTAVKDIGKKVWKQLHL